MRLRREVSPYGEVKRLFLVGVRRYVQITVGEDIILPPFLLRWHTSSTVEAPGSVVGEGVAPPAVLPCFSQGRIPYLPASRLPTDGRI